MPIYNVRAPDGKVYKVNGPEDATDENLIATLHAYLQQNKPKQAGFTESFKEAFGTLGAAPAAARFATAETPEEKAAARRELLEKTKSEYETTSFADIKDLPSAVDWASQVAGSSAGFLAAPAAAAFVNPVAGIGALASQYTTSGLTRQAQEQEAALARGEMPEETSVGKALAAAGVQTGLDYLGFKFFKPVFSKLPGLSKFFSTDADTATGAAQAIVDAAQAGKYSIKNGVFKGLAKGVAFEVPQEIAQSVLDRWQAGQPISPADPDARAEYYESAAGAVLLGGTLGAGSGFMQNRAKLKEAEELKAKARAEREAQQKALDKATAEEAEVEKEKKRKERELAKEDAKEKGKLELETAADIARKTITEAESEENALRNELMARMGLGRAEASELVKQLVRNKVLKYDKDTGLHTIREAEAPPAFDLANIKKPEEPKKEEAKKEEVKKEDEIPYGEKEGEEAKKPPAPAVEPQEKIVFPPPGSVTETTTDASDQTGTERPVTGADTGGVESPVSGPSATGSVTAGTEPTGVGGTLDVSDVGDAGKKTVEPALTEISEATKAPVELTAERWRERLTEYKADDPTSFRGIVDRINNLKSVLPAPKERVNRANAIETVAEALKETEDKGQIISRNALAKRANTDIATIDQILADLEDEGVITVSTAPRGIEVVDEKKLKKYLKAESSPLQDISDDLSELLDKYDQDKVLNSTDLREQIDKRLTAYEQQIEAEAVRREKRKQKEASERAEVEAALAPTTESAGYAAAQEGIATKIGKELADVTPQELEVAATSGNMGAVLDIVRARSATDFKSAEIGSPEANLARTTNFLSRVLSQLSPRNVRLQVEGKQGANPEVFDRLKKEQKLAEYDPKTRTVYVTKKGLSPKILLHEFVHAATVETLRKYEVDPTSLTQEQREGVEHLQKTFELAKKRLGGKYRTPFENIYEFASYALSEPSFQRDMAKFRVPAELIKYSREWGAGLKTLWNNFTQAVARMVGLSPRKLATYDPKTETVSATENFGGLESIQRDTAGNLLIETLGSLENILAAPVEVEGVAPLPARRQPKRQKVAQFPANATEQELLNSGLDEQELRTKRRASLKGKQEFLWGRPFWERLVRTFQNDRRVVQSREEGLTKAGKTVFFGDKVNSVSSLISLSSGQAYHNFMTQWEGTKASLKQSMDKINTAVYDYAKATGVTSEEALNDISLMLAAKHEPERRFAKFLLNVPLSNDPKNNVTFGGVTTTPAKMRDLILKTLHENTEKGPDGKALLAGNGTVDAMRAKLEELAGYKNGVKVGPGFIDTVNGLRTNETKPTATSGDLDSEEYNVIGVFAKDNIEKLNGRFERLSKAGAPTAEPLKNLVDAMQDYQEASKYLDRQANYWSVPVDNITRLYNFKSYVPLKGYGGTEVSRGDDRFEIGKRIGGEYIESSAAFEGRQTLPDNVVAQVLVDGTRAAMRAARKDVTLAIKNLKLAGGLKAKKIKTIPFSERYKGIADLQAEKGETKIFHYMPDGSIEIWEIRDKAYLHGVRRMYEQANPYWDFANRITSGIGHLHTRYNPAFYPYNFVRDTLTNAFTLGTEMNRAAAFQYLGAVAANVAKNKFSKANKISRLYAKGDVESIKKMAQTDEFARDVLRYLQLGGRVSYIQGLALEGQLETLEKQISKNKFATTGETVNRWIDAWADMFEFTSRVSAFNVARNQFQAEGLSKEDAEVRAAAYAKNLANFEQVGELGRKAGALFMFFRPAATGAVRAIDSLMPLFEDVDSATKRLPEDIQSDPQAVLTFRQNHLRQREAAKTMLLSVAGAGAVIYTMALMGSDDDESGRNRVQTDDMALWTRNIRLPLSVIGKEGYLQIPWGFGIGAFAAAGAQIAGAAAGPTNVRDMAGNLVTILLDSYVPIPVSRINPLENPGAWALDSMMPSAVRPVLEFMMNVDGLGREIYNNRMTKYGDAYTGGRNTPIIFKDAADVLFNITNGDVQVSPDTMHFFANNYVDGAARILGSAYGLGYTLEGTKDFNAKEDFILVSSFLGRQGNFDAREFASVEKKIKNHEQAWNALLKQAEFKQDYSDVMRYLERYPNIDMMIKLHNKVVNSNLKDIREDARAVQSNPNVTPKQKKEVADQANLMQNFYKRQLIDLYKQYGLEP
jgi:hypothetical protein